MASEIYVGDIGTTFKCLIKDEDSEIVNVSGANLKQITFRKPGGTVVDKSASFTTDGADGYIQYVSVSGDLNAPGMWSLQAYVGLSGAYWHSTINQFKVHPNIG